MKGTWSLTSTSTKDRLPVRVPGNVHEALLAAGQIPDPYVGENERDLQWVGETEWRFSRKVTLEPELLEESHLELVCESLDTLATLYWNGTLIGKADNQFRRWVFDIREAAVSGENTLEIRFASPIPEMEKKQADTPLRG